MGSGVEAGREIYGQDLLKKDMGVRIAFEFHQWDWQDSWCVVTGQPLDGQGPYVYFLHEDIRT